MFELDFSQVREPGEYVVAVEGVGCSYPFPIADRVWRDAFIVSAKGFYHQRSGIALGPPYTGSCDRVRSTPTTAWWSAPRPVR